jgi:hypothetical protein
MLIRRLFLATLPLILISATHGQARAQLKDDLLDKLTGQWALTGTVAGKTAHHDVQAEWVLNHQFLRIHEQANPKAGDQSGYEAWVFVGYNKEKQQYVAHWLDVFGGSGAEAVGFGKRTGDSIVFNFDYPDGAFETTFRWNPDDRTWQWLMRGRQASGEWKPFADLTLRRK